MPYKVLVDRLGKLKWSVEKAFNTPVRYKRVWLESHGDLYTCSEFFLRPTNIYVIAKNNSLGFAEFVKCVFGDSLKVYGEVSGEMYEVKATKNLSNLRDKVKINKEKVDFVNNDTRTS